MNCPKCQLEVNAKSQSCPRCGIVFEKYYKYHPRQTESPQKTQPAAAGEDKRSASSELARLLLRENHPGGLTVFSGRAFTFAGMILFSLLFMFPPIESNAAGKSFLHLIDLPFHEAGHIFFRPFGAFITSLGGSLGQLIMPAICVGVLLLKTRDAFGASVALWWFGENFLDIAPYMNDARAGQLPLVGGNFGHSSPYGFHDWEYLLTESGFLQYDHVLAKFTFFMGAAIMSTALFWGGILLQKNYKSLSLKEH